MEPSIDINCKPQTIINHQSSIINSNSGSITALFFCNRSLSSSSWNVHSYNVLKVFTRLQRSLKLLIIVLLVALCNRFVLYHRSQWMCNRFHRVMTSLRHIESWQGSKLGSFFFWPSFPIELK